jgi:hypothetical protein
VSIAMRSLPDYERGNTLEVAGFNVVFTGVSQEIFGQREGAKNPLGVLGLALESGKAQRLRYDAKSGRVSGELRLYIDASWLATYARPEGDGKNDQFSTPTIPVVASIDIDLGKSAGEKEQGVRNVAGSLNLKLATKEFRFEGNRKPVPPFKLELLKPGIFEWEFAPIFIFEVARRLCIQPVRLLRLKTTFPLSIQFSGSGLPFGEPGLREHWRKADVTFEIRDWKTLFAGGFWELSSSETSALRDTVEDDDCIEAFFVNSLDPDDLFGGGATFGSGTASAQVISSDDNARNGIDFTHLAHEFGHVLGLRHPDAPATASAVPANTGTLLCPSGFMNDNPRVNSQGNEDLLQNPLLRFSLKLVTAGPDCIDSADCGACP